MNKIIIIFFLITGYSLQAQSDKIKNVDSTSLTIELMGEKIQISQKRIDSITQMAKTKLSKALSELENEKQLKFELEKFNSKLDKIFDVLIEDKNQLAKVKKEMSSALKQAQPKIDSAIKQMKIAVDKSNNLR